MAMLFNFFFELPVSSVAGPDWKELRGVDAYGHQLSCNPSSGHGYEWYLLHLHCVPDE